MKSILDLRRYAAIPLISLLAACGQTGPLYLPNKPAPVAPAPVTPAGEGSNATTVPFTPAQPAPLPAPANPPAATPVPASR